ncbi:CAP-associated domain-containing protein [Macrococcus equipercicus]|uniref:CAP domain-containing protein n=1 Tax=Macrococcus equipercicus TaxID=69967 RepID=A0A9Q9F0F2_9STAP|nr:CAP-associated domain-containing protein [Macrococcus equipercicus]UTH12745.1 CAP domain-containing protein [Macrococcus equipercicus]
MKKLLLFLLLAAGLFIFPLRILSLPDDWTLAAKHRLRDAVSAQSGTTAVRIPKSYIDDIKLGMSKQEVDHLLGPPKDQLRNQYQNNWNVYHDHYRHFILVNYTAQRVTGIYTVAGPFTSDKQVSYGMTENSVRQWLGAPLEVIEGPRYRLELDDPHMLTYLTDGVYYTYYFDQHEDDKLVGMKVTAQSLENRKPQLYASPSPELAAAYEKLDYHLINADRVKHGLPPVSYHDRMSHTAVEHSIDMAEHHFFSHTNKQGLDPFDRMQRAGFDYIFAGENLAYGQLSPIEAHHGLMNSLGHRKNILNVIFKEVGIGVAFDDKNIPFYTEDYITEN